MMSIYLHLFHGRKDPNENLDDWGENGPVFGPLRFVQGTYVCDLKLGLNFDTCGMLSFVGDCLYYDGMYYGDYTVFGAEVLNSLEGQLARFEQSKANPPAQPTKIVDSEGINPDEEIRDEYADMIAGITRATTIP